jgi:hypothetical protein
MRTSMRGELAAEAVESGLTVIADLPLEGVGWLAANSEQHWADCGKRDRLLQWIRETEHFQDLLPVSAHGLVIAKKLNAEQRIVLALACKSGYGLT